ncbi:MAG: hypothetical protein QGH26_01040 [Candidatus Pacebacteria bacterium]|nr:hypothetical protein [Candidatus Paceibacterota bacterium]MDP7159120.1 hypothetical protein [Candidatus Paceibacterota bacterium]
MVIYLFALYVFCRLGICIRSIAICREYIDYYAIERRIGREPTLQDMARIWNGGPNGYKKPSTKKYWEKVKEVLKTEK